MLDDGERVVPEGPFKNGYMYDPSVDIVQEAIQVDAPMYQSEHFGTLEQLQLADENGQGYYLVSQEGTFGTYTGPVLIKYLGAKNEVTRQRRDYCRALGLDPDILQQVIIAENVRNRERELAFVSRLDHINIVKILAFMSKSGSHNEIQAIVMEGASEGPLDYYSTKSQLVPNKINAFAYQLADVLAYCHNQQIIHRDVRPRNIYVFNGGTIIKLGNFGFARVSNEGPMTANQGDEIVYKAPEMFGNYLARYTCSVDTYSFSLVLWTICHNGRKPFDDVDRSVTSNHKKFQDHLEGGSRPNIDPNTTPPHIEEVIKACWENETPESLRPTMQRVKQELERHHPPSSERMES